MTSRVQSILKLIAFCIAFISLSYASYLGFQFYSLKKDHIQKIEGYTQSLTNEVAQNVSHYITPLKKISLELAQVITTQELKKDSVFEKLKNKPVTISSFGALYINSETGEFKGNAWTEKDDTQVMAPLSITHTNSNYSFIPDTLNGDSQFVGPISDPATGDQSIIYATPFYSKEPLSKKEKPAGIIFATQSLKHINHILFNLHPGKKGEWILTQKDGKILLPFYAIPANKLENTNNDAWRTQADVLPLDWKLEGVFNQNIFQLNTKKTQSLFFAIILLILIGILTLILSTLGIHESTRHLWIISALFSLCIAATIIGIWFWANTFSIPSPSTTPVYTKIQLYELLDTLKKTGKLPQRTHTLPFFKKENDLDYYLNYRYKHDTYIPTGILINDIELSSPDRIEFVGYIWQRYFDGIHDTLSRGFILPQLADNPDIKEISRVKDGKEETIVWLVRAQLNQRIDHRTYPFNQAYLDIELRHANIDKNIILVPDFDAYPFLQPRKKPGIGKEANINGWEIIESYFGFNTTNLNTNLGLYRYGPFGMYKALQPSKEPALIFTTRAQHHLLESLLTELIPLFVIALLLFLIMITDVSHGFANLLVGIGSVFFATILAHSQLRTKLPSYQIVYLDSFFLIMYALILIVTIISMMHLYKSRIPFIQYRNNLISKLLYWPVLLGAILASTIWYLYPHL